MKKLTLLVAFTMLLNLSFAGGLLTNSNQSAQYVRMLARAAGLEIDAVFYNPAGLVKMEDGWHFAFHNQTIFQTRTIDSKFGENTPLYPILNDGYYEGDTKIPIFPNFYAVYKKDKWAFSIGAGPSAGGGTATFDNGLPSLEIGYAKAALGLAGLGVTGYDLEMAFDASSTYWGIQLGATYAINEKFSVYGGARLLPSINQYEGYVRNVQLEVGGNMMPGQAFLSQASGAMQAFADMPQTLNPYLDAAGGYTLSQLEEYGQINPTMKAGIEAGLKLMDLPQEHIDMMTLNQINGAYVQANPAFQKQANDLSAGAEGMADKRVDVKQKGFGITPIIGFNYSPNDDWTFAAKYEFKTNLVLENENNVDSESSEYFPLFEDGVQGDYDVPAILTTGIAYRGVDWLEAQLSYNIYFDKDVDFGYNIRSGAPREIDNHGHEVTMGFQFNLSETFAISVGGLALRTGVAESYQSDFSFANDANGFGTGIMWKITDQLVLDAGISKIWYKDETVTFTDPDVGAYDETYGKKSLSAAVGLSYSIF